MKEFGRMKRMKISSDFSWVGSITLAVMWLLVCGGSAVAATGTSPEFKVDLQGMGPWEMRTAAAASRSSCCSGWPRGSASTSARTASYAG